MNWKMKEQNEQPIDEIDDDPLADPAVTDEIARLNAERDEFRDKWMRALADANVRCARSAPAVMLPASAVWRKSRRSVRSKRTIPLKIGVCLSLTLRLAQCIADCRGVATARD